MCLNCKADKLSGSQHAKTHLHHCTLIISLDYIYPSGVFFAVRSFSQPVRPRWGHDISWGWFIKKPRDARGKPNEYSRGFDAVAPSNLELVKPRIPPAEFACRSFPSSLIAVAALHQCLLQVLTITYISDVWATGSNMLQYFNTEELRKVYQDGLKWNPQMLLFPPLFFFYSV